mmetsp:Transcript_29152/g.47283  ORF Transcript_29152/g.47283 Transcript_29152/m.47283 type:complete len:200 (-) Transcript_29152:504-1103(-)
MMRQNVQTGVVHLMEAGVLLTADLMEAGALLMTIVQMGGTLTARLLGRMIAGVVKETKDGAPNRPNQKLQNLGHDPYDGFLHQVAIGYHYHMVGCLLGGEVIAIQMTSAGAASGEETIVPRQLTSSSGIDQCMARARLPSQRHQRRNGAAGVGTGPCRTAVMTVGGVLMIGIDRRKLRQTSQNLMIGGIRLILFQAECG